MRKILISAAAIAFAASGAYADPGNGKGNGGNKGGGNAAMQAQGQGNGNGNGRGNAGKPDKQASAKSERGSARDAVNGRGGPPMQAAKSDRGPPAKAARADRGKPVKHANKADRSPVQRAEPVYRDRNGGERREAFGDVRTVSFVDRDRLAYIEGCPPGLAKKNNGCMPPGLAKKRDGLENRYYSPSYFGYSALGDGRYYYDDGYLYRTGSNGSILGYIPLLGGALSIGNTWPGAYQPVRVPDYYRDYYNLGPVDSYRYADDVLYRIDPQTSAITSIAALLTGDEFAVGQPLPPGYDVYNVPYGYRDRYYDTPDSYYRYADGYVYQVDPTTQLIQAAIQLLT